jgi:cytochrome c2
MHDMMRRLGIPRPTFTGQEISDLSAFVRAASRSAQTERIYVSPGNPQDGAKVYEQKGCANCHSSGQSTAPLLASLSLHKSAAGIAGMMWNHGEQMFEKMQAGAIPWPIFEGKEMADLIAYLYFVKFVEPPGNAVVGKTFFQEKKCGACHSIQGVGGSLGPDLALSTAHTSNIAILASMLNHSETMSEAVLNKGDVWPLLNGQEMRDTFAYIKAVSGIKRAAVQAAIRPQDTARPLVNGSPQRSLAQPSLVPQQATPRPIRVPTGAPKRGVSDVEPAPARVLSTIPDGYQVVDALIETAQGSGLIQKLKDSLGEKQTKSITLAFHPSPEFISKADFTWTPRNLKGVQQVRIFVPTLSQAGLTVMLDGEAVWSPADRSGQNILSPQIDLNSEEPKLRITVDSGEEGDVHGGVDDIYVLRPKVN